MYLLPSIEINNKDGDMRIDFAVGENLQTRLVKKNQCMFDYSGAIILIPLNKDVNTFTFYLDDSDGGLEILLKNKTIDLNMYEKLIDSMKKHMSFTVHIMQTSYYV